MASALRIAPAARRTVTAWETTGRAVRRAPGPRTSFTVAYYFVSIDADDGVAGAGSGVEGDWGVCGAPAAVFFRRARARRRWMCFTCGRTSGLSRATSLAIPYAFAAMMAVR